LLVNISQYKSVERKNHALPGYQGYRPKITPDALHMKTFAEQSRDVFTNGLLDDQKQFISSTGFNKH
jgi:hypothetical protein